MRLPASPAERTRHLSLRGSCAKTPRPRSQSVSEKSSWDENFAENCSWRGLNTLLGAPNKGLGTGGPAGGHPATCKF